MARLWPQIIGRSFENPTVKIDPYKDINDAIPVTRTNAVMALFWKGVWWLRCNLNANFIPCLPTKKYSQINATANVRGKLSQLSLRVSSEKPWFREVLYVVITNAMKQTQKNVWTKFSFLFLIISSPCVLNWINSQESLTQGVSICIK